ncbi:MAG TPA: hypothetical protein VFA46_24410 [Actinomycetes bacterium]|nr:hypothetical protein [Actinomycetes bacterium]
MPEWDAVVARELAALDERIRRCGLPLVGLVEPAPVPRLLGDCAGLDDIIESIGLLYGAPERPDGPLVQVHTARWGASTVPPSLADLLEQELDRVEDDAPVAEVAEQAVLVVDGERHPAVVLRAGVRFWAARCGYRDAEVTVVARDWDLDVGAALLVSVPDVEPFLRGRREYLAALRAAAPAVGAWERADVDLGEVGVAGAHRALVDALLERHARVLAARGPGGRRPRSRGAERAGRLWEAAVRAQMRLADQPREQADQAVTAMVNQLAGLQEEAAWFGQQRLREAAIGETLLYWTGLRLAVPSQAAQEAWRRAWAAQQRHPAGGRVGLAEERLAAEHGEPEGLRGWFEVLRDERGEWLAAWAVWARSQSA